MKKVSLKLLAVIVLLLSLSSASAADWYHGGTLHGSTIKEWWEATPENRIATCGDFIAKLHMGGNLNLPITDIDSVKPYATELAVFIDTATEDLNEVKSQKVADFAIIGISSMGWIKQ